MKKCFCVYCCLFLFGYSFSQESRKIEQDTTFIEKLDEVVVTGQYNPQSVKLNRIGKEKRNKKPATNNT